MMLLKRSSLRDTTWYKLRQYVEVQKTGYIATSSNIGHRHAFNTRPFMTCSQSMKAIERAQADTAKREPDVSQDAKPVNTRVTSPKASLRRVAVEAERSRGSVIRGKGKYRFVDPHAINKKVTAFCVAEQYDISSVAEKLTAEGYTIDPFSTNLFPQVIHFQPSKPRTTNGSHKSTTSTSDVFVFPSGTVVAWNVPEAKMDFLLKTILCGAETGSLTQAQETETLDVLEDPNRDSSSVVGDTIILGTKFGRSELEDRSESRSNEQEHEASALDNTLVKIAFSSGISRSVKLSALENSLSAYFESTRDIPVRLSKGLRLPFNRAFILRKTGELLSIRAQLNLYSELTDSLPDLFWDSRHELGLEGYYDDVGRALDVGIRIKLLNNKMDYAGEIASILRERLSEKHGLLLELCIIALIFIEVVFEILRQLKESRERSNPKSTEALLKKFLEKALKDSEG